jgi:hypothetical protein
VTSRWSMGAGSASKNRRSRAKSVASSVSPARWRTCNRLMIGDLVAGVVRRLRPKECSVVVTGLCRGLVRPPMASPRWSGPWHTATAPSDPPPTAAAAACGRSAARTSQSGPAAPRCPPGRCLGQHRLGPGFRCARSRSRWSPARASHDRGARPNPGSTRFPAPSWSATSATRPARSATRLAPGPGQQLLGQLLLRGRLRLVLFLFAWPLVSRSSRHLSRQAIKPGVVGPKHR